MKQKDKTTRRQNKRIKTSINKSICLKWIVKTNTTYLIKMFVKIHYQESRGQPFKAYVKKKQDTYCLRCKKSTDKKSITAKQAVSKLIAQKSMC